MNGWMRRPYRRTSMNATIDQHRCTLGFMSTGLDIAPVDLQLTSGHVSDCACDPAATASSGTGLSDDAAVTYAEWFATLADPTRVRLLHAVSSSSSGAIRVGDLAALLG